MAERRICSIDGCEKPHLARDLCRMHYKRLMAHGNVEKPDTPSVAWLKASMSCQRDTCQIWPFGKCRKGYGSVRFDGRYWQANRLICQWAHGDCPSPRHEAAHSCGNASCCNPWHIRWATPEENCADKVMHGRTNRGGRHYKAKMTEDLVREIKRSDGSNAEIAKRLRIKTDWVYSVKNGLSWSWVE